MDKWPTCRYKFHECDKYVVCIKNGQRIVYAMWKK